MRLGVLDIGSNTGHLLVVDAHGGAAPLPAYSHKEPLRLAEHLDATGRGHERGRGADRASSRRRSRSPRTRAARRWSASPPRRSATPRTPRTCSSTCGHETGVDIEVLPGEDEARLTFLAVRRWFGWSSGRLAVFDIGGGSLEIAAGSDEAPDVAQSLPLGAGRLTREHLAAGRSTAAAVRVLRRKIRAEIARDAGSVLRGGAGPRGGHLEDVPVAGPDLRRGPVRRRPATYAGCCDAEALREILPRLLEMTRRGGGRAARGLAEPGAPAGGGRAGRRRRDGPVRPRRSSRSARGRCARASSSSGSTR